MSKEIINVQSNCFRLLVLIALAIFSGVARADEKTTLRDVLEMEADIDMGLADVAKSYSKIEPFLKKPDPRLSSLLAKFIVHSKGLSRKQRDTLFAAAMKVADARAFGCLQETLTDTELLPSLDVDIIVKIVILTGRTKHPKAAKVLRNLYDESLLTSTRAAALHALGELNARTEIKFILKLATNSRLDTKLRDAALISSVRLGNPKNIPALIALTNDLAGRIDKIASSLSYLASADKRQYTKALNELAFLRRNAKHSSAAMRVACAEHPAIVFDRYIRAHDIGELELYYQNLDVLVSSLPVDLAIQAVRHPSILVGSHALKALGKRMGSGSGKFGDVLLSLMREKEPSLRARVFENVAALPDKRKEAIIQQGLNDPNYLCREAAVRSVMTLPAKTRTRLLNTYVRQESFERLRASALWILKNPAAKSLLP
ncbi:MAG: hypothetical protein MJH11_21180 [Lentisphaeria bacterium]|nr:hypothetical protein [Lentisphaeria bacterium]